jgi:hypothetical protein
MLVITIVKPFQGLALFKFAGSYWVVISKKIFQNVLCNLNFAYESHSLTPYIKIWFFKYGP